MFYVLKTKRMIKIRCRQRRFYDRIIGYHVIILNNQFGQFILCYFILFFLDSVLQNNIWVY